MSRPARFLDAVRSEWTKLRTLRSVGYALAGTALLGVGIGALMTFTDTRQYASMPPAEQAAYDPTGRSLAGFVFAQLTLGFLGALVLTAEYATGTIHGSLTVVPRRGRLLAAKLLVFAGVAVVVGELVGFASFLVGQRILAAHGVPHAALTDPEVLRAVVGYGLYLAVVGLFGAAVGTLVRATAGAVAIVAAATFVVPVLLPLVPESLARWVGRYWFSLAGRQVMTVGDDPYLLGPWSGFAVMCASVAVALIAALVALRRRDA
jgi:ABC-2 type transport system permease protein